MVILIHTKNLWAMSLLKETDTQWVLNPPLSKWGWQDLPLVTESLFCVSHQHTQLVSLAIIKIPYKSMLQILETFQKWVSKRF